MITKHSYIFSLILTLLAFQSACGQNQTVSNNEQKSQTNSDKRIENVKSQTNESLQATLSGDVEKIAKFVFIPNTITDKNSSEAIKEYQENQAKKIARAINILKSPGVILEGKIGSPQEIVDAENQLFSVVPSLVIMTVNSKKCEYKSFIVAISQDKGETWKFHSGTSEGQKELESLFPEAAKKIKLPEYQKPICY